MPFKSEAQRGWMYANEPAMAKKWEKHTPKGRKLPERVKKTAFELGFDTALTKVGLTQAQIDSMTYGTSPVNFTPEYSRPGIRPSDAPSANVQKMIEQPKPQGMSPERIKQLTATPGAISPSTRALQGKANAPQGMTPERIKELTSTGSQYPKATVRQRPSPAVRDLIQRSKQPLMNQGRVKQYTSGVKGPSPAVAALMAKAKGPIMSPEKVNKYTATQPTKTVNPTVAAISGKGRTKGI